ncbi:hypothetical protein ACXR2U_19510 [Jatrophihabitans sp. YIM 134969]
MTPVSQARRLLLAPLVLLLLALGAGWAATSSAAAPCPYVGTCSPTIGVTIPTIAAGATQSFTVGGFTPGDRITLTLTYPDGRVAVVTVVADAQGNATGTFVVPADASGTVTLTATGSAGDTASTTFVVIGADPTDSPTDSPTHSPTDSPTAGVPTSGGGAGTGGSPDSSGGGLAYTGAAVGGIAVVSLGLLVAGGVLLVLGRRRRPLSP